MFFVTKKEKKGYYLGVFLGEEGSQVEAGAFKECWKSGSNVGIEGAFKQEVWCCFIRGTTVWAGKRVGYSGFCCLSSGRLAVACQKAGGAEPVPFGGL